MSRIQYMLRMKCLFSIVFYITCVFLQSSFKTPASLSQVNPRAATTFQFVHTTCIMHISIIILTCCLHQMSAKRVRGFERSIYIVLYQKPRDRQHLSTTICETSLPLCPAILIHTSFGIFLSFLLNSVYYIYMAKTTGVSYV
jgi:hypothetical protein